MHETEYQELRIWIEKLQVMTFATSEHFRQLSFHLEKAGKHHLMMKATGVFEAYIDLYNRLWNIQDDLDTRNFSSNEIRMMLCNQIKYLMGGTAAMMMDRPDAACIYQTELRTLQLFYTFLRWQWPL